MSSITVDETQPLLERVRSLADEIYDAQANGSNQQLVDFDSSGDPENPLEWSKAYKRSVVLLLAFMAFTV